MGLQRPLIEDPRSSGCDAIENATLSAYRDGFAATLHRLDSLQSRWLEALPAVKREFATLQALTRLHRVVTAMAMRLGGYTEAAVDGHAAARHEVELEVVAWCERLREAPVDFPFELAIARVGNAVRRGILNGSLDAFEAASLADPRIEACLADYARSAAFSDAELSTSTDLSGCVVVVLERDRDVGRQIGEALFDAGCDVSLHDDFLDAQRLVRTRGPSAVVAGWATPGCAELLLECYLTRGIATVLGMVDKVERQVVRFCTDVGVSRILTLPATPSTASDILRGAIDGFVPLHTANGFSR